MNNFYSSENWILLNPIETSIKNKIEQYGTPLSKWDIQINYGIKTGYNNAFIINESTKNALIASDPKSAELIRPILRGKDVKRYSFDFAKLWVIYVPCGYTNRNRGANNPEIWFKENHPSIYSYLINTENELSKNRSKNIKGLYKRDDQGDYWWELRSCKYMDDFMKQKLIWTPVNSEYKFTIIPEGYFFNNSIFMITGEDLYYLCGILNSDLYQKYFEMVFTNGSYNYGSAANIKKLPIIKLPKNIHDEIKDTVKIILSENKIELCSRIDELIYSQIKIK